MYRLETDLITTNHNIQGDLRSQHYSMVRAHDIHMPPALYTAWDDLQAAYHHLPADEFLPNGGAYRFRRYDSFEFTPASGALRLLPHTRYFQSEDINTVTGGLERDFAPLTDAIVHNPFLQALVRFDFAQFPVDEHLLNEPWRVDVHLIRVVAKHGETGHPTPEGIHRDGAAYVTVHLAELDNVVGGAVSIYDDSKAHLDTFTLQNVLDAYLFRDEVLWHGVTPIEPLAGGVGVRSILTFDYYAPA